MAIRIPILMYHSLEGGVTGKDSRSADRTNTISPEVFQEQMALLHQMGYSTVSLNEVLNGDIIDYRKRVIITFDDGYYSTYKDAYPILKAYNFIATVFVPTGTVGQDSFTAFTGFQKIKQDRPMTWEEIRELSDAGWEIESHSVSHPYLSGLTIVNLAKEVVDSKTELETQLGKAVKYFAYPFGDYNTQVLECVKEAGYAAACSVHTGMASSKQNKFRLARIEITNLDDISVFKKKVARGYGSFQELLHICIRNMIYKNSLVKETITKIAK